MRLKIVTIGVLILILGLYIASWKIVDYMKEPEPWNGKSPVRPMAEAVCERWPGQVGLLLVLLGALVAVVGIALKRKPKVEPAPAPAPEPEPQPEPEARPAESPIPAQTETPKQERQPATQIIKEKVIIKEIVRIPCRHCGSLIENTAKTCTQCGAALG